MGRYTDKTTITQAEYQQLLGLMLLARRHNKSIVDIIAAACEITGEKFDVAGLAADEIYAKDPDADALLKKHDITVADG